MNDRLSREEIEQRYPHEWVLVGDPETNEALEVLGGPVLHHSKDREAVYRKAIVLKPKRFAFLFLGPVLPKGTAAIL